MRFNEFKIIKEAAAAKIVVIGDSIAVGIGQAIKGAVVNATVGINSSKILANASSDASVQGAELAIVSAGSNDIVKGNGDSQKLTANITAIKDALGAKKYVWILPYDKVASEAVKNAVGGDKTVNLTSYSSSDGLHPSNYSAVATAARAGLNLTSNTPGAPASKYKESTPVARAFRKDGSFYVKVPAGRSGPEVADVQKALIALGYSLPKHGVDGVRGPETIAAVKKFQQDNKLTVDGDPGPDTVAALNAVLTSKPDVANTLKQSTIADVKVKVSSGSISPADVAGYLKSKGLDSNQVLGILTNIQGESSFRPAVMGDNGTSGGLFQHHKNRFASMVAAAGDDWGTNWKGQIDFALSERPGQAYVNTKFNTPEEATAWWTKNFEIPADIPGETRKRIAMIPTFQAIA